MLDSCPVLYEKRKSFACSVMRVESSAFTDSDKAAEAVIKLKGAIDLQKGRFVP